jgi:hypothetical protein
MADRDWEDKFREQMTQVHDIIRETAEKFVETESELLKSVEGMSDSIDYTLNDVFKLKNRETDKDETLDYLAKDIIDNVVPSVCDMLKNVADVVVPNQKASTSAKNETQSKETETQSKETETQSKETKTQNKEANYCSNDTSAKLKQLMFDELMYVAETKEQRNDDELQSIAESFKRVLDRFENE